MPAGFSQSISTQAFCSSVTVVLLIAAVVAGACVSISATRSIAAPAEQLVNYAGKANRLLRPARAMDVKSKLPRGCESLVSPLADAKLARIARQCLS